MLGSHDPNDTMNDTIHIVISHSMWLIGLLMILVVTAVILNGILLTKIILYRQKIFQQKRYYFITNLAASDFCMAVTVGVSSTLSITRAPLKPEVYMMMTLIISLTTITTLVTYASLSGVQYLAIKNPIYYHVDFGSRKCLAIIASSWLFVLIYCIAKVFILTDCMLGCTSSFGWVEAIGMGLCLLVGVASYISALRAALRNVQQNSRFTIKQYRVTISVGIVLLFHCVSTIPLMLWWIYLSAVIHNLYFYHSITCQISFCIWFSRTSFNPLVLLLRETAFRSPHNSRTSSKISTISRISHLSSDAGDTPVNVLSK